MGNEMADDRRRGLVSTHPGRSLKICRLPGLGPRSRRDLAAWEKNRAASFFFYGCVSGRVFPGGSRTGVRIKGLMRRDEGKQPHGKEGNAGIQRVFDGNGRL